MKVGSSDGLSPQMQQLENAALRQYQSNPSFDVSLNSVLGADGSTSSSSSAGSDVQLSGSFQTQTAIAIGKIGPDGKLIPFPADQVAKEFADDASMQETSYADSLHNFLMLAQESSVNGQLGAATY